MNNLPTLSKTSAQINFNAPEVIATLKATVAKGLTDAEFVLFAEHCKGTGLNPFKKEVWAIKGNSYTNKQGELVEGRLQIMTGINGFYEIANRNPRYDGMESGLIDPQGEFKTAAYPKEDFIGAWAKVYRKDRRIPEEAVAFIKEYDKSLDQFYPAKGVWRVMKRMMITKCAQAVGLRKAFPQELNGLYAQEEMPVEFGLPDAERPPQAKLPTPTQPKEIPGLKTADEIDAPEFHYDLVGYPVEKLPKMEKNLESIGAKRTGETTWCSPKSVKQLRNYEIGSGEMVHIEEENHESI